MALKHLWMKLRDIVRFTWAKSKFDFVPQGRLELFSFAECHHIVVLKLDGKLGDTQVMSHFYSALRQHNPRIYLSVVCSPNLAEIYRDILGFDQVITASRKPRFKEIKQLCQQIQEKTPVSVVGSIANKVDLVITTEPNFRPRDFFFNHLLQPRYVAGCETNVDCVNILIYDPHAKTKKVAECFIDLMDKYDLEHDDLAYTRFVTPASLAKMSRWLHMPTPLLANEPIDAQNASPLGLVANLQSRRFLLAINPRASSASRSFKDDFVVTLIQTLQAQFGSDEPKAQNQLAAHVDSAVEQASKTAASASVSAAPDATESVSDSLDKSGAEQDASNELSTQLADRVQEQSTTPLPDNAQDSTTQNSAPDNVSASSNSSSDLTADNVESKVSVTDLSEEEAATTQESINKADTPVDAITTAMAQATDTAVSPEQGEAQETVAQESEDLSVSQEESANQEDTAQADNAAVEEQVKEQSGAEDASASVVASEISSGTENSVGSTTDDLTSKQDQVLMDDSSEQFVPVGRDLEFVVLTPPNATELKNKVKAAAVNCGASVLFLPDESTVLDLSSTIELCDALITVDTAAVHMACASEKPQLCVYTGTNINESLRWAPIGNLAQVVRYEGKTVPEIKDQVLLDLAIDFVQKHINN